MFARTAVAVAYRVTVDRVSAGIGGRRTRIGRITPLVVAVAALALGMVAAAGAGGVSPSTLMKAGWTCFNDPAAPRIVCSDPGHGRPVIPAPPDRPASYNFKIFSLDATFVGTVHLIRDDLYQGQPCPQTGGAYFHIAAIGYYRCEHF